MNPSDLKYLARLLLESCRPNTARRTGHDWFYFLHIPKTAGTTFRFSLYDYFPQREIYPNFFELLVLQKGRYLPFEKLQRHHEKLLPAHKRLLLGHYGVRPWGLYGREQRPKTLTIFRNPEKRVMSSIQYHQACDREYSDLSTDEIIEKHAVYEGCRQARALGYVAEKGNLEEALNRIEEIEYVGLSESFDRSLALCNRLFGWKLENRASRNIAHGSPPFSQEQIEKIERASEVDRQVYERAKQRFERLCAEAGV